MTLIRLSGVRKAFGPRELYNSVDLSLSRGERVAMVGPNGAGKTTLFRIVLGEVLPDGGSVHVAQGARLGYLSQTLRDLQGATVFDEVATSLSQVRGLGRRLRELEERMEEAEEHSSELARLMGEYQRVGERYEREEGYLCETRIRTLLFGLGLEERHLHMPISELSGGEKMKVALARLLLESPNCLLLDEPTNHLDIEALEWLEGFFKGFPGGVLFVSHDRYFMDRTATKVAELDGGDVRVYTGNYSAYVSQKQRAREAAMRGFESQQREIRRLEEQLPRLQKKKSIGLMKSRRRRLESMERVERPAKERRGPRFHLVDPEHVSDLIAETRDLGKSFEDHTLFRSVDLLVGGGEKIGLIGPNGSGKSTFLRILLGLDGDFDGQVRVGGWVTTGYLRQHGDDLDDEETVLEEIRRVSGMKPVEIRSYLARFHFVGDDVEKRVGVLSGGERNRLVIARLILQAPDFLVLDEPTNYLDIPAREALEEALDEFPGTVLIVSHDRYLLDRIVTRVFAIEERTIRAYEGNYTDHWRERDQVRLREAELRRQREREERERRKREQRRARRSVRTDRGPEITTEAVEADIGNLEERISTLEREMSEPALYADEERAREVVREYRASRRRLEELYDLWAEIGSEDAGP